MAQENSEPSDEEIQEGAAILERLYGRAVGTFTLDTPASNGERPDEVGGAWVGVRLPVRPRNMPELTEDGKVSSEVVRVYCVDGFNALVAAETDEKILQYWIDELDGRADPDATFAFSTADGKFAANENRIPIANSLWSSDLDEPF